MRPERQVASAATVPGRMAVSVWLLVLLALIVAAGAAFLGAQRAAERLSTELALRPPVVVFDMAAVLREVPPQRLGTAVAKAEKQAERLAAGGFLVLDAQAVIAAPPELYLGADAFPAGAGDAPQ